jgi:selenocysteine lyase/cysteine desulfurase
MLDGDWSSDVCSSDLFGGTGSRSEQDRHPGFMPDRLEAGTPNTIGLAGLKAGVDYLLDRTVAGIRDVELGLAEYASAGLGSIDEVEVYGRDGAQEDYISIFSLSIPGKECSEVAKILDDEFGIMVRSGLHCAPWAHEALGTASEGTFRISLSPFTTREELDALFVALTKIVKRV